MNLVPPKKPLTCEEAVKQGRLKDCISEAFAGFMSDVRDIGKKYGKGGNFTKEEIFKDAMKIRVGCRQLEFWGQDDQEARDVVLLIQDANRKRVSTNLTALASRIEQHSASVKDKEITEAWLEGLDVSRTDQEFGIDSGLQGLMEKLREEGQRRDALK